MDPRRNAWVVAGFAAALDLALVVCGYGFVSLLADVDVVADPEVGVLVAPVAVGASVLAVLLSLGLRLVRPERMAATVVITAIGSWLALVVVAIIGHLLSSTGSVMQSVAFGALFGLGWFGLLVPVVAAVVAVLAVLVARGRSHGMARPRWPWERDDVE
jgi:Na+/phosphate symporter